MLGAARGRRTHYFVVNDHDHVRTGVATVTSYFVARLSGLFGSKQTLEALSARDGFAGDAGVEIQHGTSPPRDDLMLAVAVPSPHHDSVIG